MWLPATWMSLEARDPGALALLGQLPDFMRLRTLLDDLERLMDSSHGTGPGSVCAGVGAADGSAGEPELSIIYTQLLFDFVRITVACRLVCDRCP